MHQIRAEKPRGWEEYRRMVTGPQMRLYSPEEQRAAERLASRLVNVRRDV